MGMKTKILLKIYGEAVSLVLVNATYKMNKKSHVLAHKAPETGQFSVVWGIGGKGQGSGPPWKIRQLYGSLAILVTPGYYKTSKPAFLMFGLHWSTSKTPFKWHFAGNLNGVSLKGPFMSHF